MQPPSMMVVSGMALVVVAVNTVARSIFGRDMRGIPLSEIAVGPYAPILDAVRQAYATGREQTGWADIHERIVSITAVPLFAGPEPAAVALALERVPERRLLQTAGGPFGLPGRRRARRVRGAPQAIG
jgi:hypothetical protein